VLAKCKKKKKKKLLLNLSANIQSQIPPVELEGELLQQYIGLAFYHMLMSIWMIRIHNVLDMDG